MALLERELLPIHGTEVVLLHEVLQALETVRMSAGGVHGLEQRLKADMADEFIVHFILEVVEMIVQQEVELTTFAAEFANLGCVFFWYGISHGSQHQALSSTSKETCRVAAAGLRISKERESREISSPL